MIARKGFLDIVWNGGVRGWSRWCRDWVWLHDGVGGRANGGVSELLQSQGMILVIRGMCSAGETGKISSKEYT